MQDIAECKSGSEQFSSGQENRRKKKENRKILSVLNPILSICCLLESDL